MVEADGEWHTIDNKYASANWKMTHPHQTSLPPSKAPPVGSPVQPVVSGSPQVMGKGKVPDAEILVLDSDEDEDERPPPSYASSSRTSFDVTRESTLPLARLPSATAPRFRPRSDQTVIDLTLDESDEDLPVSNGFGKRKASDANLADSLPDQLWKKGRIDSSRILPAPRPSAPIGAGIRPVLNGHPPSPTNLRFPSFPDNTLPPVVFRYNTNRNVGGTGSDSPLQLPPIGTAFAAGQPTSSHHHAWP